MNRLNLKRHNQALRQARIRTRVHGTSTRPRLSVHISLRHVTAQIINDETHQTIISVTTVGKKDAGQTMTDKAIWTGKTLATKASAKKVKKVVFDRNGRLFHGRIKALAEAARHEGLEF